MNWFICKVQEVPQAGWPNRKNDANGHWAQSDHSCHLYEWSGEAMQVSSGVVVLWMIETKTIKNHLKYIQESPGVS